MTSLPKLVEYSSVICALVTFVAFAGFGLERRQHLDLAVLLTKALKASTLPTAIMLVASGFDADLLQQLKGMGVYLAAAGLATGFVAIKALAQ
jgi:hypothetical protein